MPRYGIEVDVQTGRPLAPATVRTVFYVLEIADRRSDYATDTHAQLVAAQMANRLAIKAIASRIVWIEI